MPTQTSHTQTSNGRPSTAPTRSGSGAQIRSYPAPPPLATPTDLKPNEVQAVVEAINPIIADSYALYVKTKNYHWHLAGSHFRDYHLLFDEQADAIFGSIDPLAERMRRIGGTTIRSISHIGQLQTIDDDNDEFVSPEEMIQNLIADNRHIAEAQRAAIETCEKNRDTVTGNLLQEILDETEKRIWFLFEVCQGGKHME
jgi:starvation-inducible DNA-binding protein